MCVCRVGCKTLLGSVFDVYVYMQACVAAMVRIEHMDFLQPMKIGEVASVTAEIVYTSTHSLLVAINIRAENIITGTSQLNLLHL